LLRVAVWMAAQREPAGKALFLLGAAIASCIDIHTGKRIEPMRMQCQLVVIHSDGPQRQPAGGGAREGGIPGDLKAVEVGPSESRAVDLFRKC